MSLCHVEPLGDVTFEEIDAEAQNQPPLSRILIEYQIPLNIKISEIYFYQNYIQARFTEGRTLLSTIQSLESGAIKPQDIPSIEALHWRGKWYGMGNRRLACYHYVYRD
eukprot:PhF_6_TR40337/c1_g1_i1/m.59980